jgi:magnesium transporter
MIKYLTNTERHKFDWLDINSPSPEELDALAKEYHLHSALVKDCLQQDHLPKFEALESYNFIIFRIHTEKDVIEADSVQELTHKIAVFYSQKFIITIHRKEQRFTEYLMEMVEKGKLDGTHKLLNALIFYCLETYNEPLSKLSRSVDYYEQTIFLKNKRISLLKSLYYLKRKVDVIRNTLMLSNDIIESVDNPDSSDVNTRNTRDAYIRLKTVYNFLSENINQLLNIYFSTSSQRTNEIMRVLTVFSVFFMPLTFIVGIYGMNFQYMPELSWKLGYPAAIGLMVLITIIIYLWFRRKGWV